MAAEGDDEAVRVAEMFGDVARSLATHDGQQATLTKIVHLAVEHPGCCDFAGISLIQERKITSPFLRTSSMRCVRPSFGTIPPAGSGAGMLMERVLPGWTLSRVSTSRFP